jgi:formylglycine-generating enzyme required for sulfatase activity
VTIADPEVALRVRIAAGDVLGYLGDPRLGELIRIPAGEFWLGSETEVAHAWEKPAHKVYLAEFYIDKYPLTNSQYTVFVESGGYQEQRYWTEAGWAWRLGDFGEKPEDYEAFFWKWVTRRKHFDRPEYWLESRWNKPNYPVVGITWYEAIAYTRWLTELWRSEGKIEPDQVVRLPTEAEWEKVARGGLEITGPQGLVENDLPRREYPWGEKFEADRLNIKAGGEPVGQTSPVGIFSRGCSPYGCLDMSGNVWEWCSSVLKDYPYIAQDGREDLEVKDYRVLRGESWLDADDWRARCSYRGKGHPAAYSGALFGTRIVVGLPLS